MGIGPSIDITAGQRRTILALLERHLPDTEAWVYGSRLKGTSRPQSDLDMVVFATPGQKRAVSDLREAFEESNLPFRVDLFVWDEVPESFRGQIEEEHVVLVPDRNRMQTAVSAKCGWPTATIREISEKVAMGPFGSSIKVETFVPEGVPIISGQHLHGVRVDDAPGFNFITQEHAKRLENANVRRGDVVFTHRGNIGQVAYVPERSRFDRYIISQSQFYMRCDRSKAVPEFVALYFTSPEGQHKLLANASQVGVPSIAQPVTYLRTIEIPLPPLPEQRAIAHILGTLDDKIELNRRMNETLEAMAHALFKSWFVDFDPVRAKMEGRDTGLPEEIADLFPDRLEESELGEIPAGWEVRTLGDICHKPQYGYTASAKVDAVGPHFLRITDINKESWVSWSRVPYCEITESDLRKYRLEKGDILIARMADPGHGILVEEDVEAVFASYLIRFRPTKRHDARILQYWLKSDKYWQWVKSRASGTTRMSLNAPVLSGLPALVSSDAVAKGFSAAIDVFRDRLVVIVKEMELLSSLRDMLLPKLISGEIRICEGKRRMGVKP